MSRPDQHGRCRAKTCECFPVSFKAHYSHYRVRVDSPSFFLACEVGALDSSHKLWKTAQYNLTLMWNSTSGEGDGLTNGWTCVCVWLCVWSPKYITVCRFWKPWSVQLKASQTAKNMLLRLESYAVQCLLFRPVGLRCFHSMLESSWTLLKKWDSDNAHWWLQLPPLVQAVQRMIGQMLSNSVFSKKPDCLPLSSTGTGGHFLPVPAWWSGQRSWLVESPRSRLVPLASPQSICILCITHQTALIR